MEAEAETSAWVYSISVLWVQSCIAAGIRVSNAQMPRPREPYVEILSVNCQQTPAKGRIRERIVERK